MNNLNSNPGQPAQGQQPSAHQLPPVDPGNPLLCIVPVALTTDVQQTPAGQRAAVTFRTSSTTFTAILAREELDGWIRHLTGVRDGMSSLHLPGGGGVPGGGLPGVNGFPGA